MDRTSRPKTGTHRVPGITSPVTRSGVRGASGPGYNIAASLDALVRSIRSDSASIPRLIDRTLGYWQEWKLKELEIIPAGMCFQGKEVFAADEEQGRWLLPAFMAGLRTLRPWPDIRTEHLHLICEELADLTAANVKEIERFQDWLWADGAEGFDVTLDLSFSESIDTAFDDLEQRRKDLAAVRVETAAAFSLLAQQIASQALDAAAALPELQTDLGAFESRVDRGAFTIPPDEREHLELLCVDPIFWAEAQVDVVLDHMSLQEGMPATRLAGLLMQEFRKTVDLRLVELIARLGSRQDPYARSLLVALETEPLGRRIADEAPMTNRGVRALAQLMVSGPVPIARGAARGLIERAVKNRDAFISMKQIASSVVFPRFCDLLDMADLDLDTQKTLGLLVLRSKDPPRVMPKLFDAIPIEVALGVLSQTPPHLLWEARGAVGKLLVGKADPSQRRQVVRIVLGTGDDQWLSILGRALAQTCGEGWCAATLKVTCDRMSAGGLENEYLIPLIQDTDTTDDATLAALRALERNPDALKEATKFHFRELTHSKDVRQRLRKLRKRLKEES